MVPTNKLSQLVYTRPLLQVVMIYPCNDQNNKNLLELSFRNFWNISVSKIRYRTKVVAYKVISTGFGSYTTDTSESIPVQSVTCQYINYVDNVLSCLSTQARATGKSMTQYSVASAFKDV